MIDVMDYFIVPLFILIHSSLLVLFDLQLALLVIKKGSIPFSRALVLFVAFLDK